ncbi:hypothetical protein FAGKG844_20291 [Frankia sp. AgKG'84/4]
MDIASPGLSQVPAGPINPANRYTNSYNGYTVRNSHKTVDMGGPISPSGWPQAPPCHPDSLGLGILGMTLGA